MVKQHNLLSEHTLESLVPLNSQIVVISEDGDDAIDNLCQKYKARHVVSSIEDYSNERNHVTKESGTDWQMYIEPGEVLGSGHEKIIEKISNESKNYRFYVLKSNIITKEIRLWHKDVGLFKNPIFETLSGESEVLPEIMIYSAPQPNQDINLVISKISEWRKEKPMSSDPYYYEAFARISEGQYDKFVIAATNYLNQSKPEMASVVMRYYLATILLNVFDNISDAVKNVIQCIYSKPQMAEFWCLLGDAYYKKGLWEKSKAFYENAIVLGRRRSRTDFWPFDIAKYKEYPESMIATCNGTMTDGKIYGTQ